MPPNRGGGRARHSVRAAVYPRRAGRRAQSDAPYFAILGERKTVWLPMNRTSECSHRANCPGGRVRVEISFQLLLGETNLKVSKFLLFSGSRFETRNSRERASYRFDFLLSNSCFLLSESEPRHLGCYEAVGRNRSVVGEALQTPRPARHHRLYGIKPKRIDQHPVLLPNRNQHFQRLHFSSRNPAVPAVNPTASKTSGAGMGACVREALMQARRGQECLGVVLF